LAAGGRGVFGVVHIAAFVGLGHGWCIIRLLIFFLQIAQKAFE
jgi:hypothetical protein